MKTIEGWDQEIMKITLKINQDFPELAQFITEIPIRYSEDHKKDENISNLKEYYNSLIVILARYSKTHLGEKDKNKIEKLFLPGYPLYASSEDIYEKGEKEMELNPDDLSKSKVPNEISGSLNEKSFEDDMSGDDLDIPGAELDDSQEKIGSEDEENNYYSLGGDRHNKLDETNMLKQI